MASWKYPARCERLSGEARFSLYAAAGCALLAPDTARAQTVVYHDPMDIQVVANSPGGQQSQDIDLNSDGQNDLKITAAHFTNPDNGSTGFLTTVTMAGGNRFSALFTGSDGIGGFTYAHAPGTTIDGSGTFGAGKGLIRGSGQTITKPGFWQNGADQYLGIEFKIGMATHYGWARLMAEDSDTFSRLTLKDWAYSTTPGQPIITGTGGESGGPSPSPVPEPSSLALFAAGTAALGLLRRRRSQVG